MRKLVSAHSEVMGWLRTAGESLGIEADDMSEEITVRDRCPIPPPGWFDFGKPRGRHLFGILCRIPSNLLRVER